MRLRDIRAYGHLYKDLLGRYKHKVVFLFSLTFVNGLLGSLGIASLAPLFSLVVKDAGASKSVLAGYVSTILYQLNIELGVTSLLIFVASLFTIKALTLYIFAYVSAAINLSIANDVKERIYRDALASHWAYLSTQKISYLDHSLSSDVGRVIELLEVLYKSQLYLASFIFYFFTAFFLSPNVTIAAIIIG